MVCCVVAVVGFTLIVLLCSLGTIAREEWKRWVKPEELESISVKICYLAFLGFGM